MPKRKALCFAIHECIVIEGKYTCRHCGQIMDYKLDEELKEQKKKIKQAESLMNKKMKNVRKQVRAFENRLDNKEPKQKVITSNYSI